MTYQGDFTLPEQLLEQITAQGTEFLPELIRVLVNAAMKAAAQLRRVQTGFVANYALAIAIGGLVAGIAAGQR